jgi:serine/threonine protein kinase
MLVSSECMTLSASDGLTQFSMQGVVCIGDFGHTQVLDEVLGREGFTAYTGSSNMRWNAPELLGSDDIKPTKASDVFAFGMSILELVTKQAPPYSHRKRDLTVIMDISDGRLPLRPTEPEDVSWWMHDEPWEVLNKRWVCHGSGANEYWRNQNLS